MRVAPVGAGMLAIVYALDQYAERFVRPGGAAETRLRGVAGADGAYLQILRRRVGGGRCVGEDCLARRTLRRVLVS